MIITPTTASVTVTEAGMISLAPGKPIDVDDDLARRLVDAGLATAPDDEEPATAPSKPAGKRVTTAPSNKGA